MSFRSILALHFTLIIFLCTISCTPRKNQDLSALKVALSSMPSTLDPRKATDATGMRLVNVLFQALVRVDEKLEVQGDAAESWTYKNKAYVFTLKNGLTFHNGRPVTKEDILFSFEEFKSERSPFASAFAQIKDVVVTEKEGKLIVSFKVDSFSAKFLSSDLPVLKILPKAEVLSESSRFADHPIGSGPLRYVSSGLSQLDLERYPPLPEDSLKFNNFEFKVVKDDFTRSQKLIKGELDVAIAELPADLVMKLKEKEQKRLNVMTYPGLSMTYILLNLKDKTLSNKAVRKALSQAIHRAEIIQYKLMGLGQEATSLLTPTNPYFFAELKNPSYDLKEAKHTLSKIKQLSLKTSSKPDAVDNGKVLANQLEKAGVHIQLESFEWGTFYNDVKSGNFQMATMKWIGAFDPDIYRIAFHSSELSPGRNRSHYVNHDFDQLAEKAYQIEDLKERKSAYNKIQKMIFEDFAIIPLWYETQTAVLRNTLTAYSPSPLSDYVGLLNIERVK